MADKITQLTAGIFILLAAIGTTYFVAQDDTAYQCTDTNTVGLCFKLSNINDDGLQTRCYYNESAPTKYKNCNTGWLSWKDGTVTGKEITLPTFENSSTEYTIVKDDGTFETWSVTKTVDVSIWEDGIIQLEKDKQEWIDNKKTYTEQETKTCIQSSEIMWEGEIQGYDNRIEYYQNMIDEYK